MPNRKLSRRDFIKILAASSAGLALTRRSRMSPQSSSDPLVEELARAAFAPFSEDKMDAWWQSYRTLNFDQVELLTDLVAKSLSEMLKAKGEQGHQTADAFGKLRSEANKRSMELYKVPFNQLDSSQLNAILESIARSPLAKTIRAQAGPLACSCYNYTGTTTPGGSGTTGNGLSYISASQTASGCEDCDWEVTFPYRINIKYCNWFAQGHYNQLGGRFIYRTNPGPGAKVVFGYWTTLFWQGHPSYLLTGFRMD